MGERRRQAAFLSSSAQASRMRSCIAVISNARGRSARSMQTIFTSVARR